MAKFEVSTAGTSTSPTIVLPEIHVFKHINFNFQTETVALQPGELEMHKDRLELRTSFDVDLTGDPLDKNISSVIVYSGHWKFFDSNGNELPPVLGPGHYARLTDIGIPNDMITSFKRVSGQNGHTEGKK